MMKMRRLTSTQSPLLGDDSAAAAESASTCRSTCPRDRRRKVTCFILYFYPPPITDGIVRFKPVTLNTTGRETPYFLLTSGLEHGPWRPAAANK